MQNYDLTKRLNQTPEEVRLYQRERAKFEATELICETMKRRGVTRSHLAKLLKKTKGYISQILDGHRNMTIDTLSDVFWALDRSVHVCDSPISASDNPSLFASFYVGTVDVAPSWPRTAVDARKWQIESMHELSGKV